MANSDMRTPNRVPSGCGGESDQLIDMYAGEDPAKGA